MLATRGQEEDLNWVAGVCLGAGAADEDRLVGIKSWWASEGLQVRLRQRVDSAMLQLHI